MQICVIKPEWIMIIHVIDIYGKHIPFLFWNKIQRFFEKM